MDQFAVTPGPGRLRIVAEKQVSGEGPCAVVHAGGEGKTVHPGLQVGPLPVGLQGEDPPAAGVVGVAHQPAQRLEVDGHGQVCFLSFPEGLVVVQLPDGPGLVPAPFKIRVDGVHVHPAGGRDGQVAGPEIQIRLTGRAVRFSHVPLCRPLPGEVLPLQADQPRLTGILPVLLAVEGVEQTGPLLTVVVVEFRVDDDDVGEAILYGAPENGAGQRAGLPVHHPQQQGVFQVVLHKGRPQDQVVGLDIVQQAGGGRLNGFRPAGGLAQCLKQRFLRPIGGENAQVRGSTLDLLRGGAARLSALRLLHLARHQIAAKDTNGKHQRQKQHRRPLLRPGHNVADTQLRLPGRSRQGSGEGRAGNWFIHG